MPAYKGGTPKPKAQLIVAQALTNEPPDTEHLVPMIERVIESSGKAPTKVSADAGCFSEENVSAFEKWGVDPYVATCRAEHGEHPPQVRGRPPANLTPKQPMNRKLATRRTPPFTNSARPSSRQFLATSMKGEACVHFCCEALRIPQA